MGGFDSVEDARTVRAEFKAAARKSKKLRRIFEKYQGREETEDEENTVEAPDVEERVCKICGKCFLPRRGAEKYCSDECRKAKQRAYSANYRAEKLKKPQSTEGK